MTRTAGIYIGSGAVKTVLFEGDKWVARRCERIRRRDPMDLARQGFDEVLEEAKLKPNDVAYVATKQLLRTIVIRRGADDYVFVLVPGGRQIDWPKLRAHLGVSRLSLPDQHEAWAATGYERGAITPFGSKKAWPVIADETVLGPGRVAISGGARGVNVHLEAADIVRLLGADVVDVTKPDDRA